MRYVLSALLACVILGLLPVGADEPAADPPQDPLDAQWIWCDEGNPAQDAAAGNVWFRYEVPVSQPSTGLIRVLCDDHFVVWVNGHRVGEGSADKPYRFSLSGLVDAGTNVIAVEAENREGRAGLFVTGGIRTQSSGGGTVASNTINLGTSAKWQCTRQAPEGDAWLAHGFRGAGWKPVKVLGPHAESPWKDIAFPESALDRFDLAPGFVIERIGEPDLVGSLVKMTWGNRGRLIVSRERGPIVSLIDSDNDGIYDQAVEYTAQVQNCQGLCMVFDELYAVGEGPKGIGIYRLPDRNGDDQADEVTLVKVLDAPRMGEHGPHNVEFGPDGWLYYHHGNIPNDKKLVDYSFCQPEATSAVRNYYEGNLLEPAYEDPRGHALGVRAPGGCIWRFTPGGQRWFFEASGFRNHYDFAFNAQGELFSYDSDMEWDVGMPWYRPTRVTHAPPGADFGWHSGAKNWPAYFYDSLPATVDVGRGSPTGVVFYEHEAWPDKYRGALIICDWSLGRMLSVFLKPNGSTFSATTEVLATGNPLNVSDIDVDRDGSIVFVTGGRNSEGGVYRIRYQGADAKPARPLAEITDPLDVPQMQTAWAREKISALKTALGEEAWFAHLSKALASEDAGRRARALVLLAQFGPPPTNPIQPATDLREMRRQMNGPTIDVALLRKLATDSDAGVRGMAIWMLGMQPPRDTMVETFTKALDDPDPAVQRRACEAFVHAGLEAPVEPLVKLLNSEDRFLRFAARLALERVPLEKWRDRILAEPNHASVEAFLAWYRTSDPGVTPVRAGEFASTRLLERELKLLGPRDVLKSPLGVDLLRAIELTLILTHEMPESAQEIGKLLLKRYPTGDANVDMEAARLIAWLQAPGGTQRLIEQLEQSSSQEMQIHLALCLAYCDTGWNDELLNRLLAWYETTNRWEGGASFGPYLVNIVGKNVKRLSPEQRRDYLRSWSKHPFATQLVVRQSKPEQIADFIDTVSRLFAEVSAKSAGNDTTDKEREELLDVTINLLGKSQDPAVQALLRKLYDEQPDRRKELVRMLAGHPDAENWPYLLKALPSADSTTAQMCLAALAKVDRKATDPADLRTVIVSGLGLGEGGGKLAVKVLNHWTGEKLDDTLRASEALGHYQDWFHEKFPNEAVPEAPKVADADNALKQIRELNEFLDTKPGQAGDPARGKQIFAKANCVKCHLFKTEGAGIGPDLTTVRKRFQRRDILESILLPSKVISDQYRAITVITTDGITLTGVEVKQPDPNKLVLMQSDTQLASVGVDEIENPPGKIPSQLSVMPEGLLKELSLEEIADLFAFLETSKDNEDVKKEAPKP